RAEAEAKARAEAEARARQEAEAARLKAEQEAAKARAEAEAARLKAEQEAACARAELEAARARAEAEAKARAEAEARAKQEAEAARLKAEQEAAKVRAEAEARAKQEAEAARIKAAQETAKVRAEAEAARINAAKEAETVRLKAEQETMAAKAQFEAARAKAEAEAKARAEAGARARQEAEAAQFKAEQEAARAKAELESAKAREVAAAGARAEADARARQEAEAARLRAEQEAHRTRAEAGEQAGKAATRTGAGEPQPSGSPAVELAPIMLGDLGSFAAQAPEETGGGAPREKTEEEPPLLFKEFAVEQEPPPAGQQAETGQQLQKAAELQATAERKIQAEAETARASAEQEAAKIKQEATDRAETEEAARKMAEEQAKVWAEAEQRARALAEAQALVQAESGAQSSAKPQAPAKVAVPAPRRHRKPLPWGKMVAGLFVLLLVSAAVLPYLWPMQDYSAKIENTLSEKLRQKVHIGHMKAALLPLPKLELQDVSVGNAQELKAGSVVLNFGISALFSGTRAISNAEVVNLALGADSFDKALGWIQAAAGDARFPVAHMKLQHVRIGGEGSGLPTLNGSTDMDVQGRIIRAVLNSEDGKLGIELKPQQANWQIALSLRESSLPLLPEIKFNELNAKGEASGNAVSFSEMDGRLYGGMFTGNAKLNWQKGWQLQGQLTVKALELQKAISQYGVSGEMDGDARFTLSGEKLAQLTGNVAVDGSFVVKKGVINNMDIVETASSSRQSAGGGRTHFDELSGMLQVDGGGQHLRQVKIAAGVMSASGAVDINPNRQLSGRLNVDLKMRAGMGSVPLSLSGEAGKPVLRVAR
ncbi:MAG: hypothetical protein HY846_12985, partial [Nitrosomonadales bacterium]|nr:hypothetical protein [Nitrosomonadales bacterium]